MDVDKEFKKKGLHENFCLVPFTTIQLEADGNINMCRQKGTEFSIGNIKEKTIEQIWNDEPIRKIRREFIENKISTCLVDIKNKKCNLCVENNKILAEVDINEYQTKGIQRLGFNINGKCNLQCQMCHVWKMPNGLYTENNFWIYARNNIFPGLKEVELLSGEPFLQQDTYKLIDELSQINPSCKWIITTNGHWMLNKRIKNELDRIWVRNIIISIDSLNFNTYAKIRKNGNLEVVLKNLHEFRVYNKTRKTRGLSDLGIRINYLIQKDNWKEIKEILSFHKDKKDIKPFITFLYEPNEFSLLSQTYNKRIKVLDTYLDTLSSVELSLSMRVIRPLVNSLKKEDKLKYLLRIKENVK